MAHGFGAVAALEEQEREAVVRAGKLRRDLERAAIASESPLPGDPVRVNAIAMFWRIFVSFGRSRSASRYDVSAAS